MNIIKEHDYNPESAKRTVMELVSHPYSIKSGSPVELLSRDFMENSRIEAIGVISENGEYEGFISRRIWLEKMAEDALEGKTPEQTLDALISECPAIPVTAAPLDVWDKDEIDQLNEEIWFAVVDDADMFLGLFSSADLLKYLSKLTLQDLFLANKIQGRLNRKIDDFSADNYSIGLKSLPAKNIGGDLVYSRKLKNGNIVFALFDVSGKGYAAALVTGMLYGVLSLVGPNLPIGTLIRIINKVLHDTFSAELFATAIIGVYNEETDLIEIADMGHSHCYLSSTMEQISDDARNIPLGIKPAVVPKTLNIRLEPGDTLIFMSDGIFEQQNENGELYDISNIFRKIEENKNMETSEIINTVFDDYKKFIGLKNQHDDASLIMIRRN